MKLLTNNLCIKGIQVALIATVVMLSACSFGDKSGGAESENDLPPAPLPVSRGDQSTRAAQPKKLMLRPNYPEKYTVERGDTLWDIAARFLEDPWRWPEVWQKNPQVSNPHLIFPGDELTLYFIDGKPYIMVERPQKRAEPESVPKKRSPAAVTSDGLRVVKIKPQMREETIEKAIPTIPVDKIEPFLIKPRVVTEQILADAPYIVSSIDGHLIAGTGNRVYVRGVTDTGTADYVIVRKGDAYINPKNEEDILGHEAIYIGEGRIQRLGEPATLQITRAKREVLNGDRLLPAGLDQFDETFIPRAPEMVMDGEIISVVDGVSQIGQYQIVVINIGRQEEIASGHVLAIYRSGTTVRDTVYSGKVQLPEERSGLVMIFRVFDRISYGIIMDAERPIHVNDRVRNP